MNAWNLAAIIGQTVVTALFIVQERRRRRLLRQVVELRYEIAQTIQSVRSSVKERY